VMDTGQKIRFINALHALESAHAIMLESIVEENALSVRQGIDEKTSTNRTMHEYARVMHIMSSSDNMAAISRALGRYNRLELDESKSKLHEDLQFSVSGWKQLEIVFNDPLVRSILNFKLYPDCKRQLKIIPNHKQVHFHHACEEEAPNAGTPIDICDPEVYSVTMDIDPNHDDIFNGTRDSKWFKETYQFIKKRGHQVYRNWKKSSSELSLVGTP
jgi:hypothetical protein